MKNDNPKFVSIVRTLARHKDHKRADAAKNPEDAFDDWVQIHH